MMEALRKHEGPAAPAILLLCLAPFLSGATDNRLVRAERSEIYDRGTNYFAAADFYKPAGTNEEDLRFKLAPLILQEVRTNELSQGATDLIASCQPLPPTLSSLEGEREKLWPTVFVQADSVQIRKKVHARFTYVWFYHTGPGRAEKSNLEAQGVRITLNSSGQPAIWEILNDPDGMRLIFVARSVEAGAEAEFGKPQPGRHHAVERSLEEAPNAIVPRVIDDGPVPMGPMIYLQARTRSVTTLICRCMPAQAKSLLTTRPYQLRPLEAIPPDLLRTRLAGVGQVTSAFFNENPGETPEKLLRLPSNF